MQAPGSTTRRPSALRLLLPAAAMVAAALCLRGPFAAVGPLLGPLGEEYGLSTSALAVVTALPLVCFGVVSPFAPALAARLGLHRALLVGMGALAVGVLARSAGAAELFAGTVLLTGGIAVVNVLLPAAAREEYGPRSPAVVGAVVASMAASATAGAGLAAPLADLTGSARSSLLLWLVPVLAAVAALAALARARRSVPPPAAPPGGSRTAILRDRVAIAVTVFFGLQSLTFYAMLTWLPEVLLDETSVSAATGGVLTAVAAAMGIPASLVVPQLAARRPGQVGWVLAVTTPTTVAVVGLLLAPGAAPLLWAVLYGLGTGTAFPLAMTLVLQRTRDAGQTGRLSAGAQSLGYLLAAVGPFLLGLLHELTGGWTAGLGVLLVVLAAQALVGVAAARPRLVDGAV
ncbi:MFS transporter [Blastococcus sp. SYSU D00669]